MDQQEIDREITTSLADVETVEVEGNIFYFYRGERMFPFATLMVNDENDQASDLNRPGVYRLNVGMEKGPFRERFGANVASEAADHDYTALDRLMPHPVYGQMFWVCILNPSRETFEATIRPLLIESHARSVAREERRAGRDGGGA